MRQTRLYRDVLPLHPLRILQRGAVAIVVFAFGGPAAADYTLTPLSGGLGSLEVVPGQMFSIDLMLEGSLGTVHNSAVLRVVFSEPGLRYVGYDWAAPYGMGFDDSRPSLAQLPLLLGAGTLSGPGYPAGVVDIELGNVVPVGTFGSGRLVTLEFQVPLDFTVPSSLLVSVEPDTIANGFQTVQVSAGQAVQLMVVPGPSAACALFGASWMCFGRRRRS